LEQKNYWGLCRFNLTYFCTKSVEDRLLLLIVTIRLKLSYFHINFISLLKLITDNNKLKLNQLHFFMKNTIIILIFIVIFVLGINYFFSKTKNSHRKIPIAPSPSTTEDSKPLPSFDKSDLKVGGSSFSDPQGVFVLLYPADYILDTKDKQHVRIYKTGATQKGQTEMYDGVIIVFEKIDLHGKTLQNWVEASLRQTIADGSSEIIQPQKNIVLNKYPGFTYTIRSLGQATYYALQKDLQSNYAVLVTTSVNDPQQIGFQTEVDKTLSTLEILK
jgi:hypothetical protein